MALQNVCVVSTIPFANTDLENEFKKGLQNAGTYKQPLDSKGYDSGALREAVQAAGADNSTLVVTVGGLIVAIAAKAVGTVPFISLAGSTAGFTDAVGGNFLGGVCLDASKHDPDRINHLISKLGLEGADQVCLLFNGKNSAFSSKEANIFTYSQNADIDQSNMNDAANVYKIAFDQIGQLKDDNGQFPGIQAVVVSADPFFTVTKDSLTNVAGNSAYHVCYPLKEYKSGAKEGRSTIHALKVACQQCLKKWDKRLTTFCLTHRLRGNTKSWITLILHNRLEALSLPEIISARSNDAIQIKLAS